jgi:tryptophan synthase beta subunit
LNQILDRNELNHTGVHKIALLLLIAHLAQENV